MGEYLFKEFEKEKDYLFIVRTTEDIDILPKGSGIYVKKELKKYYQGLWSFMGGTYNVKVPKDKCVKLEDV